MNTDTKLFEVRDVATFIPCMAVRISGAHHDDATQDEWLASRAGYGEPCVLFGRLDGGEFNYDNYNWPGGTRTMPVAHEYIIEHWTELRSGAVVDVEFILGMRAEPKESERP